MNFQEKELIHSIYAPPRANSHLTVQNIYQGSQVFSYSFARYGLLAGLQAMGVKPGDLVLVPSFICRDVVAPFFVAGVKVQFYSVNKHLQPLEPLASLPKAKAIMAIHYFGLESDLLPFQEYCRMHGALLIEDNAHGFLSRSRAGHLLGSQGDIGLVSLRKTIPIINGAILLLKEGVSNISPLPNVDIFSWRLSLKNALRPLVASWGTGLLLIITKIKRRIRYLLKGSELPGSKIEDEQMLPSSANPVDFNHYIATMDIKAEVSRRRALFGLVGQMLNGLPIEPLKVNLGPHEVPYGYPFFCSSDHILTVKNYFEKKGLEIIQWPALPVAVEQSNPPDFYKNLYLVKFLW